MQERNHIPNLLLDKVRSGVHPASVRPILDDEESLAIHEILERSCQVERRMEASASAIDSVAGETGTLPAIDSFARLARHQPAGAEFRDDDRVRKGNGGGGLVAVNGPVEDCPIKPYPKRDEEPGS